MRRLVPGSLMLLASLLVGARALAGDPQPGDPRAIEIARQTLAAIERGWALGRYDQAGRVRAAINLRGAGGTAPAVTANIVVDRRARQWRADAAGDIGPLTLYADAERATLYVPALKQHASRRAGGLAPGASVARNLTSEIALMRSRLDGGYEPLVLRGEESLGGATTWRLDDTPAPGVTASYWIDQTTSLPRRIALDRPGRRDVRLDFQYGSSPRPTRVDAYLQGQQDVQITISPRYDATGRATRLHLVSRVAGGGEFATDVTLDWAPRVAAGFFRFDPPAGAQAVSFTQLSQGVLFSAAGKLSALLPLFLGAR
ncbi:MAG: hypothetical protein ABR559_00365 [Gemmatimonadota bacterium]